jgi:amino acid transporter
MSDENEPLLTPLQRAYLAANPEASLTDDAPENFQQQALLKGVGGWLQFLIIALMVLGPLVTVAMTFVELSEAERLYPALQGIDAWSTAKIVTWLTVAAFCGCNMAAGYLLQTRHRRSTIPLVISLIWLAGPVMTIIGFMIVSTIVESDGSSAGELGRSLGRPIVFCTIWTIYLLRSKRVENTYVQDDQE